MKKYVWIVVCLMGWLVLPLAAQDDTVQYVPKYNAPDLDEISDYVDSLKAISDSITAEIRRVQKVEDSTAGENRKRILLDVSGIEAPQSPDEFEQLEHLPPVSQGYTGTCWSFAGTSFLESEIMRTVGLKVKLSEMYVVYWEYVEKARNFVRTRGRHEVWSGSQANAVLRIGEKYGLVPKVTYPGNTFDDNYSHTALGNEIQAYLKLVQQNNIWDEEAVAEHVRLILDRHMGHPPEEFHYVGQVFTPKAFFDDFLKINPEDYVACISTLKSPFYQQALFDVYDNWTRDSSYFNLPLDVWYEAIKKAVQNGYNVVLAADVTEPGRNELMDIAVIPDYDIPASHINQHSREYRIDYDLTNDDHGLHIVGYMRIGDHDWFLLKDSGSSGRQGRFWGYYFWRGDYVKLKALAFGAHRDAVENRVKQ